MDLLHEYYEKKGFDSDAIKRIILKKQKIADRLNKHRYTLNPKSSVMALSPKALAKIRRRITKSMVALAKSTQITPSSERDDTWSNMSQKYMEIMSDIKSDRMSLAYKSKPTNVIEKYAAFEKKIRRNFHESYKQNFPDSTQVLEEVLNLMFDTEEKSFSKSLSVVTKQIQIVPDTTAKYLNAKITLWDQIQNLVQEDLETVRRFNTMPKSVFGKTFENPFKIESKASDFKMKWHKLSQDVAHKEELETFSAVWKNITHLQTTRKFCVWLANNPHVEPPAFLENEGLLKDYLCNDYSTENDSMYKEYNPEALDSIVARRFSKDVQSAASIESAGSFFSDDISSINIIV